MVHAGVDAGYVTSISRDCNCNRKLSIILYTYLCDTVHAGTDMVHAGAAIGSAACRSGDRNYVRNRSIGRLLIKWW